jgi:NDP-sugar pyrophosphorylase family protein
LLLVRVENAARYGRVDVDATGRVTAFAEKSVGFGPGWINAGVYLLAKSWLSTIPPDRPTSLEREVFPHWTNHGLAGITTEARFLDIGTPESYAQAEAFLRDAA